MSNLSDEEIQEIYDQEEDDYIELLGEGENGSCFGTILVAASFLLFFVTNILGHG
jgi:hypothetical protein